MLGRVSSLRQASPGLNSLRQTLWGFFSSDDFRATSRLTLNVGLRYEPYFGFRELHDYRPVSVRGGNPWFGPPHRPANFSREIREYRRQFSNPTGITCPESGFCLGCAGQSEVGVPRGYGIFYDSIAGIRLNRFPLNQPFLLDVTYSIVLWRILFLGSHLSLTRRLLLRNKRPTTSSSRQPVCRAQTKTWSPPIPNSGT